MSEQIISKQETTVEPTNGILPYRLFQREELLNFQCGTTAKGNQAKCSTLGNRIFIKENFFYQGTIWKDNMVECLASSICDQLGIDAIAQGMCEIEKGTHRSRGTYSYNFLSNAEVFLTRDYLVESQYRSSSAYTRDRKKNDIDANTRFQFDLKMLGNLVSANELKVYLLNMCLIDVLIVNEDRHGYNYGLIYNESTQEFRTPPLFDFGIGAFENDHIYEGLRGVRALSKCKIKNYLSRPHKLLQWLQSLDEPDLQGKIEKARSIVFDEVYIPNTAYAGYRRYLQEELL